MAQDKPDRKEYVDMLSSFARHVDAVERKFDSIRYPSNTPVDLDLPGYDAYEMPDSLVGRVVSDRFERTLRQNVDRVAAAIVMLRLTTRHVETLCTLAMREDTGINLSDLRRNITDDKHNFDGLLEGYIGLMRDGDTADTLGLIRNDINATLLDLTGRFENAAVKGSAPYELVTMDNQELMEHAGVIAAEYASTMIKLRAYKLVALDARLKDHIALYKHHDEGALSRPAGIDHDYEDVADLTTRVVDECRQAQAVAHGIVNDAYDMIEGKGYRPVTLDYTL